MGRAGEALRDERAQGLSSERLRELLHREMPGPDGHCSCLGAAPLCDGHVLPVSGEVVCSRNEGWAAGVIFSCLIDTLN